MPQCLHIEDMNFSIEEDLPILLIKEYDVKSHIKVYHAYMNIWEPTIGEVRIMSILVALKREKREPWRWRRTTDSLHSSFYRGNEIY